MTRTITLSVVSFLCIFFFFCLPACKDEPVIPDAPVVKFSNDILPLMDGNCGPSGCHGNYNPQQFLLTNYENIMANGEVKAKDAKGSKLYQVIVSNIEETKMPRKPYPDLSEKQIELVYLWIMQGAKNN